MKQPIIYYQTDPRWKTISYSAKGESTTIGASGCGPTSMAMVLATWADKSVTPATECAWALRNGYKCPRSGTYYSYFVPAAKRYGLVCKQLNGASIYGNAASPYHAQAKAAIDANHLVIACMGKGRWTSSGHYVLVWNISGNTIFINDPASSKPARTQGDYSLFKKQVKYYWVIENPVNQDVATTAVNYRAKVIDQSGLNCRKGAGTSYGIVKAYPAGSVVTIKKETNTGWGYTGDGWIYLKYTTKLGWEDLDMTKAEFMASLTNAEAYELLTKALVYMSSLDEPGWSKAEGHWAKATESGAINGGAPERLLRRDEFIAVLGRKGLL